MISEKADTQSPPTRPFLITFSGIDGAGKSTQIERLTSRLHEQGLRVFRLSFWDDVAVWSNMRAGVGGRSVDFHLTDPATPQPFVPRNNKSVRKWYLSAARSALYMLDVARLRRILASQRIKSCDVIILDRYIYDQLANVYSESWAARTYGRILLMQTPAPDLAFVLDASPAAAFARKPEYPLEFMHRNRQNFLRLQEIVPHLIIIPDAETEAVSSDIFSHIRRSRLVAGIPPEGKTDATAYSAVVPLQS